MLGGKPRAGEHGRERRAVEGARAARAGIAVYAVVWPAGMVLGKPGQVFVAHSVFDGEDQAAVGLQVAPGLGEQAFVGPWAVHERGGVFEHADERDHVETSVVREAHGVGGDDLKILRAAAAGRDDGRALG